MNEMIRITPRDTVAVALRPLSAGDTVSCGGTEITLKDDLPMGHKAALREIRRGEPVIKYGYPIGEATEDIPAGTHVHTHNLRTLLSGEMEYEWHPIYPRQEKREPAVFRGYARKYGKPGIRNELWILPTVGCVNDVAQALAHRAHCCVLYCRMDSKQNKVSPHCPNSFLALVLFSFGSYIFALLFKNYFPLLNFYLF